MQHLIPPCFKKQGRAAAADFAVAAVAAGKFVDVFDGSDIFKRLGVFLHSVLERGQDPHVLHSHAGARLCLNQGRRAVVLGKHYSLWLKKQKTKMSTLASTSMSTSFFFNSFGHSGYNG